MKRFGIIAYVFLVSMLLFGVTGSAYIDPSVMTYLIQAIAGVAIAIGAVVGLYWRRAKKKAQDKLGLEDKKEKESDEITVNAEVFDKAEE